MSVVEAVNEAYREFATDSRDGFLGGIGLHGGARDCFTCAQDFDFLCVTDEDRMIPSKECVQHLHDHFINRTKAAPRETFEYRPLHRMRALSFTLNQEKVSFHIITKRLLEWAAESRLSEESFCDFSIFDHFVWPQWVLRHGLVDVDWMLITKEPIADLLRIVRTYPSGFVSGIIGETERAVEVAISEYTKMRDWLGGRIMLDRLFDALVKVVYAGNQTYLGSPKYFERDLMQFLCQGTEAYDVLTKSSELETQRVAERIMKICENVRNNLE